MLIDEHYYYKIKVEKQDVSKPEFQFKVCALSCRLKH